MPVPEFLKTPLSLYEIAEQYWDLRFIPTQYVFSLLALVSEDKLERDKCMELSSPEGQEDWLNYCRRPRRTILEVLRDFHKSASKLTIEVLFELFPTIKPRSFSIASSCAQTGSRSLDLLVAVVHYYTKLKKPRLGLCSNWLKDLRNEEKVVGWIKAGTFRFPHPSTPQIIIGPGTGLAPFLSQIRELVFNEQASKDTLHLFFGCRYREKDFHCGEELENLHRDEKLTLVCAFSRDQEDKIYVQHRISSQRARLRRLLELGGHVFVSGSGKDMPGGVRAAFAAVLGGSGGEAAGQEGLELLERQGRYQVEVW